MIQIQLGRVRCLTGMLKKHIVQEPINITEHCNNLNHFYGRFDIHKFSAERSSLLENNRDLDTCYNGDVLIEEKDVIKSFKRNKSNKATGPDKIELFSLI